MIQECDMGEIASECGFNAHVEGTNTIHQLNFCDKVFCLCAEGLWRPVDTSGNKDLAKELDNWHFK